MHSATRYLKNLFEAEQITVDIYNDHIVPGVEQGLIKDVTPSNYIMQLFQVVGAIIQFPDGVKYRLSIYNPPDLENRSKRYNYKIEIEKIRLTLRIRG